MELMTIQEAQAYLKKSRSALYRDIHKGLIPVVRIGSKPLVVKDRLDAEMRRQLKNV